MTGTLLLLSSSRSAMSVTLAWLVFLGVLAKIVLRCGDTFTIREWAMGVSAECFAHFVLPKSRCRRNWWMTATEGVD
jgi:hypothetical protein